MFVKVRKEQINEVISFYNKEIDAMRENSMVKWKKNIHPSREEIEDAILNGEMYALRDSGYMLLGCVVMNTKVNMGYITVNFSDLGDSLALHMLVVDSKEKRKGYAKLLLEGAEKVAKEEGKKALVLDILSTNTIAEKLYNKCGYKFVEEKILFYPDTQYAKYKIYEKIL